MDNLNDQNVKQYHYDTDNGEIIITRLKTKGTNYYEWWGHVKEHGKMVFLFGGSKLTNKSEKETADYCAYSYYDEIIDTIMDGFHGSINYIRNK